MSPAPSQSGRLVTLFLAGDVMTGRGIDQVLPQPSDPRLFEPYVRTADEYLALAEARNGPIPRAVGYSYVWGDAKPELDRIAPDARIINLETSVTASATPAPGKEIHYRMHPDNAAVLTAAGIHCCGLANNHVMDWGRAGLLETLEVLHDAGIATVGAGPDLPAAQAPAVLPTGRGSRVLVLAFAMPSSGVPQEWGAGARQAGVAMLPDLSMETVERLATIVRPLKQVGDLVVLSIHWGGNWGYGVPREQQAFAHGLIDQAGAAVIHGHSSHHRKGIEVYRDRLILYGCGDFLNDYEGIPGYERFRGDLVFMYFPAFDPADGRLAWLRLTPLQIRRFRLNAPAKKDRDWMREMLNREGEAFGTRAEPGPDGSLMLRWK